jgi:hypothetical protein
MHSRRFNGSAKPIIGGQRDALGLVADRFETNKGHSAWRREPLFMPLRRLSEACS